MLRSVSKLGAMCVLTGSDVGKCEATGGGHSVTPSYFFVSGCILLPSTFSPPAVAVPRVGGHIAKLHRLDELLGPLIRK